MVQILLPVTLILYYLTRKHKSPASIKTTKGTYFLAVSVGKITVEGEDYFVVSTKSPIGKQLLGKKIGEVIPFNEAEILEII